MVKLLYNLSFEMRFNHVGEESQSYLQTRHNAIKIRCNVCGKESKTHRWKLHFIIAILSLLCSLLSNLIFFNLVYFFRWNKPLYLSILSR